MTIFKCAVCGEPKECPHWIRFLGSDKKFYKAYLRVCDCCKNDHEATVKELGLV